MFTKTELWRRTLRLDSVCGPEMRLQAFVVRFLEDCAGHWKPATLKHNRFALEKKILPHFGTYRVSKIQRSDIVAWHRNYAGVLSLFVFVISRFEKLSAGRAQYDRFKVILKTSDTLRQDPENCAYMFSFCIDILRISASTDTAKVSASRADGISPTGPCNFANSISETLRLLSSSKRASRARWLP